MKTLILFLAVISSTAAFAGETRTTPIEGADLICGDGGLAFFINTKDERVWQGDLGDTSGLEHEVIRFDRFRCPSCFQIESAMSLWGERMDYTLKIKGVRENGKFKVSLKGGMMNRGRTETFSLPCTR